MFVSLFAEIPQDFLPTGSHQCPGYFWSLEGYMEMGRIHVTETQILASQPSISQAKMPMGTLFLGDILKSASTQATASCCEAPLTPLLSWPLYVSRAPELWPGFMLTPPPSGPTFCPNSCQDISLAKRSVSASCDSDVFILF